MNNFDKGNSQVQYYSNGRFSDDKYFDDMDDTMRPRRKFPSWAKAIIIIALIIIALGFLTAGCSNAIGIFTGDDTTEVYTNFGHDYIGVVYVQGTIDEYGSDSYNHAYILNAIDAMIDDSENKGMILYVDTPGGSVYASDELYLKIREYQKKTGRPVYSSMQSQAASGGYYISAPCDMIYANRNCWTGSIGVTMGTFVDVSELLSNIGVKTETITSGDNKAMGSTTEPMTDEQRKIFQSFIDEAYEQFVSIVADGRNMSVSQVKKLADGRIYTASQAEKNGLVDEIGTFEDAINDMINSNNMGEVYVEHFQPEPSANLSWLFDKMEGLQGTGASGSITEAEAIEALLDLNGTFRVSYISDVLK